MRRCPIEENINIFTCKNAQENGRCACECKELESAPKMADHVYRGEDGKLNFDGFLKRAASKEARAEYGESLMDQDYTDTEIKYLLYLFVHMPHKYPASHKDGANLFPFIRKYEHFLNEEDKKRLAYFKFSIPMEWKESVWGTRKNLVDEYVEDIIKCRMSKRVFSCAFENVYSHKTCGCNTDIMKYIGENKLLQYDIIQALIKKGFDVAEGFELDPDYRFGSSNRSVEVFISDRKIYCYKKQYIDDLKEYDPQMVELASEFLELCKCENPNKDTILRYLYLTKNLRNHGFEITGPISVVNSEKSEMTYCASFRSPELIISTEDPDIDEIMDYIYTEGIGLFEDKYKKEEKMTTIKGNTHEECIAILKAGVFDPEEMYIEKYDEVPVRYQEKGGVISVTWECRHEEPETVLYVTEEEKKELLERLKVCLDWLNRTDYE